jgi:2-(1,2-epoxy-1,2-dihydrophenyl)acetyl-CoA isomerase
MPEPGPVLVERAGGVARVVLQRPEAMNAIDEATALALRDAVAELGADDEVRCVVLAAEGRAFCSGADLREMAAGAGEADLGALLRERYHPTILGLRTMPKPVVAAVQGPAVGVGLSLALAADLVLAAEGAYFLLAFVNIGLAPDGGASALVPDRIGAGRATRMAMLGERVPAPEALAWGLVDAVHPADELPAAVDALAARLAAGPTRSYAAIKAQRAAWSGADLARQLELEADLQGALGRTEDLSEGVSAFLERRSARFVGR